MNLTELPDLCLEKIFSYLKYDEIAKYRIVCRRFDEMNRNLLNRGFLAMSRLHAKHSKLIKNQLPRRESERRNHPLSKHSDILSCIETRLSMLSMTYNKYIDLDLCCFIPGRIIDEVLSILRLVGSTSKPLRAHEVLQELRDISSMATDHFDDEIAPILKQKFIAEQASSSHSSSATLSSESSLSFMQRSLSEKLVGISAAAAAGGDTSKNDHNTSTCTPTSCSQAETNRLNIQKLENSYKQALKKARAMVQIQTKQMLQLKSYSVEISTLKGLVTDLKKRLEEYEMKNREMAATISQMKSPTGTTTTTAPTSNIKPRSTIIELLKRRIDAPMYSGENSIKKLRPNSECE